MTRNKPSRQAVVVTFELCFLAGLAIFVPLFHALATR